MKWPATKGGVIHKEFAFRHVRIQCINPEIDVFNNMPVTLW